MNNLLCFLHLLICITVEVASHDATHELEARGNSFDVQYYTDSGCSAWVTTLGPFYSGFGCYDYSMNWLPAWQSVQSANIVNCGFSSCFCEFFSESGCVGAVSNSYSEKQWNGVGDIEGSTCGYEDSFPIKSFSCTAQ
jgi:hypothetical protein